METFLWIRTGWPVERLPPFSDRTRLSRIRARLPLLPSAYPKAEGRFRVSARNSLSIPRTVQLRLRYPSSPVKAAPASIRNSASSMIPAPATARSDSAGTFPFLRSPAKPTRVFPNTSTTNNPMPSSSPARRIWFRNLFRLRRTPVR